MHLQSRAVNCAISPEVCYSEYDSAVATTMTSQRLSVQNVAPSATVWP